MLVFGGWHLRSVEERNRSTGKWKHVCPARPSTKVRSSSNAMLATKTCPRPAKTRNSEANLPEPWRLVSPGPPPLGRGFFSAHAVLLITRLYNCVANYGCPRSWFRPPPPAFVSIAKACKACLISLGFPPPLPSKACPLVARVS